MLKYFVKYFGKNTKNPIIIIIINVIVCVYSKYSKEIYSLIRFLTE